MNRGIVIHFNAKNNHGVLRDLTTGVRHFFEIAPPDTAVQVGDLVGYTPRGLPRAEDVMLLGRFMPMSRDTAPPRDRVSELLP
jgi:hypothetical protein